MYVCVLLFKIEIHMELFNRTSYIRQGEEERLLPKMMISEMQKGNSMKMKHK